MFKKNLKNPNKYSSVNKLSFVNKVKNEYTQFFESVAWLSPCLDNDDILDFLRDKKIIFVDRALQKKISFLQNYSL